MCIVQKTKPMPRSLTDCCSLVIDLEELLKQQRCWRPRGATRWRKKIENRRGGDREKPVEEEDGADPDKDLLWILVEQFKEEVRELKDLLTEKDKELSRLGGAERTSGEPKKRRARQPTTAWRDPKAGERALRQERDQSAGGQGEQQALQQLEELLQLKVSSL